MKDYGKYIINNSLLCIMTVYDFNSSIDAAGCFDDGADDSIASTTLAELAVLKGISKIEAIDTVYPEVAFKDKYKKLKTFKFLRAWLVPGTCL